MQFYNKFPVLEDDIKPLMLELDRICQQHSIQFCVTFQLELRKEGQDIIDGHVNHGYVLGDADFPASLRIQILKLLSDMPPHHLPEVARRLGYKALPLTP